MREPLSVRMLSPGLELGRTIAFSPAVYPLMRPAQVPISSLG